MSGRRETCLHGQLRYVAPHPVRGSGPQACWAAWIDGQREHSHIPQPFPQRRPVSTAIRTAIGSTVLQTCVHEVPVLRVQSDHRNAAPGDRPLESGPGRAGVRGFEDPAVRGHVHQAWIVRCNSDAIDVKVVQTSVHLFPGRTAIPGAIQACSLCAGVDHVWIPGMDRQTQDAAVHAPPFQSRPGLAPIQAAQDSCARGDIDHTCGDPLVCQSHALLGLAGLLCHRRLEHHCDCLNLLACHLTSDGRPGRGRILCHVQPSVQGCVAADHEADASVRDCWGTLDHCERLQGYAAPGISGQAAVGRFPGHTIVSTAKSAAVRGQSVSQRSCPSGSDDLPDVRPGQCHAHPQVGATVAQRKRQTQNGQSEAAHGQSNLCCFSPAQVPEVAYALGFSSGQFLIHA